jgi:hypothetical protein
MPHELRFDRQGNIFVAERDNHVVRRIEARTGVISTVAGTGTAGFSGDGGPASQAMLRQPHSIVFDRDGALLICDIGNQRIRRLNLATGLIETYAGTGEAQPPPEGAPLGATTAQRAPDAGACAEWRSVSRPARGNAIYRIDGPDQDIPSVGRTRTVGYSGDGGPARQADLGGPKGLAYSSRGALYVADTENHVIRRIDLSSGLISTVLGDGTRGDGPNRIRFIAGCHARTASRLTQQASMSATAKRTGSGCSRRSTMAVVGSRWSIVGPPGAILGGFFYADRLRLSTIDCRLSTSTADRALDTQSLP